MNFIKKIALLLIINGFCFGCASAQNATDYDARKAAIDALGTFEIAAQADPSLMPPERQSSKAVAFECDEAREYDCETQKQIFIYNNEQEPALVIDGKFVVLIHFENDNEVPIRYVGKTKFANQPESKSESITKAIFDNYLGANYERFQPTFINSSGRYVGIQVLVKESSDLEVFLDNSRVKNMLHLANEPEVIEGY